MLSRQLSVATKLITIFIVEVSLIHEKVFVYREHFNFKLQAKSVKHYLFAGCYDMLVKLKCFLFICCIDLLFIVPCLNYLSLIIAAPSAPYDIKAVPQSSTSVKLSWKEPLDPNGIIRKYTLEYCNKKCTNKTLPGNVTETVLTGLETNVNYTFKVCA